MSANTEQKNWRCLSQLPAYGGKQWATYLKGEITFHEHIGAVKSALRGWRPNSPILVASPNSERFYPPVRFGIVYGNIGAILRKKTLIKTLIRGIFFCVSMVFYFARPTSMAIGFSLFGALAVAMNVVDYFYIKNRRSLFERSIFFYWVKTSFYWRSGVVFWIVVILTTGLAQLFIMNESGGVEDLFVEYGAIYQKIKIGEYWRLITGPFFHSSMKHYLNNVSLLVIAGPLAWATAGRQSFFIFLIGNVTGALAQMIFSSSTADGYAGISAGVFALLSCTLTIGTAQKKSLPKGFSLYGAFFILIALELSEFLNPSSAGLAHAIGIFVGIVFAFGYLISTRDAMPLHRTENEDGTGAWSKQKRS